MLYRRYERAGVGCHHNCPTCGRKCDQGDEGGHVHKCGNGHQIRGMKGVMVEGIGKNYACHETCCDIPADRLMKVDGRAGYTTWATYMTELKSKNWEMILDTSTEEKRQLLGEFRAKMRDAWEWIGKKQCEALRDNHGIPDIVYQDPNASAGAIHYVLSLDESGSMKTQLNGEEKFVTAKKAMHTLVERTFTENSNNSASKVTFTLFGTKARTECTEAGAELAKDKITNAKAEFTRTDFGNALLRRQTKEATI